jgi:hypothetical protein
VLKRLRTSHRRSLQSTKKNGTLQAGTLAVFQPILTIVP